MGSDYHVDALFFIVLWMLCNKHSSTLIISLNSCIMTCIHVLLPLVKQLLTYKVLLFLTRVVLVCQNYVNLPTTVHLTLQINSYYSFAKVCD